jgi:L-amino acid N-acyltransferase YncA
MIDHARALGHRTLIGGACTEQEASLALQRSLGFESIGVFKNVGYKFNRWLDVEHTQLMLSNE